ncbi:MAG: hypothetical protein ACWGQW_06695 [bacterium]
MFAKSFKDDFLSRPAGTLLTVMQMGGETTVSEMAEVFHKDRSTIRKGLRQCVALGWMTKRVHENNSHANVYIVTDKGCQFIWNAKEEFERAAHRYRSIQFQQQRK